MKPDSTTILKLAGAAVLLILVIGLAGRVLPLRSWAEALIDLVQGLGWIGILAFALIYIVSVILLLPVWILTVSAGLAYGLWGIPLVVTSATIGAALAYLIARRLLRRRVLAWADEKPVIRAIDQAVLAEGWKVVGLLRLSPAVPFALQNYVFGTSSISIAQFTIATFFGIIPGTALYTYVGTLGRVAVAQSEFSAPQIVLFVAGLLATVAAIVIVTRKARQTLGRMGIK